MSTTTSRTDGSPDHQDRYSPDNYIRPFTADQLQIVRECFPDLHFITARGTGTDKEAKRPVAGWEGWKDGNAAKLTLRQLKTAKLIGVVPWTAGLLCIDIDSGGQKTADRFCDLYRMQSYKVPSRRPDGWHVYIKVDVGFPNQNWEYFGGKGDTRGKDGYIICWSPDEFTAMCQALKGVKPVGTAALRRALQIDGAEPENGVPKPQKTRTRKETGASLRRKRLWVQTVLERYEEVNGPLTEKSTAYRGACPCCGGGSRFYVRKDMSGFFCSKCFPDWKGSNEAKRDEVLDVLGIPNPYGKSSQTFYAWLLTRQLNGRRFCADKYWYEYRTESGLWKKEENNDTLQEAMALHPDLGVRAIEGCLKVANSRVWLGKQMQDLDARNDLVACGGGKVLQIVGKTVQITDAEPGMLLTRKLGAAPDQDAEKMDYWKGLVQDWTGCKDSAVCLQSVIGLGLFGRATEHKIVLFMEGQTNTGKTTFAEVVKAAFGDYGIAADETFSAYNNREKHLRQGSLHGKRLALIPDLGPGQKLDASMLKNVSGGDSLTGRKLNRDTFQFKPQCLILGASNDLPAPGTVDAAIKDRWKVIPFERQFTKGQDMIEGLKTRLKDEYLGVVVEWAREGMERVLQARNRFNWSSGVVARSGEFWQRTDPFEAWLSTCEVDKGNRELHATTKELFESYNKYRESESLNPVKSQQTFGRKLKDHGFGIAGVRVPGHEIPKKRRIGICVSVAHCSPLNYSKVPPNSPEIPDLAYNANCEPGYSGLQNQECDNCGGLIKYGDGVLVDGKLLCDPDCTGNPF